MLDRIIIVTTIALLIILRGGCLTFEDGALVNRCGLSQWWSGKPMRLAILYKRIEMPLTFSGATTGTWSAQTAPSCGYQLYVAANGGVSTQSFTIYNSSSSSAIVCIQQ